jgi:putative ABC transport system substrate-binding protein
MRRRAFITLIGSALLSAAAAGHARAQSAPRRVGILMPYPRGEPEYERRVRTLRQELATLGWNDGGNIVFDERWTTDDMNRVQTEAQSLFAAKPDAVVAISGRVIPVLMKLSRTIPIVVPGAGDPVGVGWVESLARPGGNVTGFTFIELSMFGKMLEMLKQVAPAVARVMFIYNPDNRSAVYYRSSFETSAQALGVEPIARPIRDFADIERAVAEFSGQRSAAVFFPPDVTVQTNRVEVAALIGRLRLPAIYSDSAFVRAGGLLYYGADRAELFRRAAGYVDRILRGEKAGDLPFQQPTKYEFMINMKTARALGLDMSPTLLALADAVVE